MAENKRAAFDPGQLRTDQTAVERTFWSKVKKTIGNLPFIEDAIASFYTATDGATPVHVKAVLFGALAYFVLPLDAIPGLSTRRAFWSAQLAELCVARPRRLALLAVRGRVRAGQVCGSRIRVRVQTGTREARKHLPVPVPLNVPTPVPDPLSVRVGCVGAERLEDLEVGLVAPGHDFT